MLRRGQDVGEGWPRSRKNIARKNKRAGSIAPGPSVEAYFQY